ncbi:response regulator transcription factor, partial [Halochromatium sp.]
MRNDDVGAKTQVLVVDDDASLRELLENYLQREGFKVSGVADGVAMFEWLDEREPDIIILDLMLPGLDGLDV